MKNKLKDKEFKNIIKKAQNDPKFIREINKFIKITTGIYKLKDYGLSNLK